VDSRTALSHLKFITNEQRHPHVWEALIAVERGLMTDSQLMFMEAAMELCESWTEESGTRSSGAPDVAKMLRRYREMKEAASGAR
jgi:hypothetical protein